MKQETSKTTAEGMLETSPDLAGIAEWAAKPAPGGAPVDAWNPPDCGVIDMRIASDGRWFYRGTVIEREALVRLFASVLRKDEDGKTYLVTPVEKLRITIEDTPFLAVEMQQTRRDGVPILVFRTNLGDVVEVDAEHPILLPKEAEAEFRPSLIVRGRLEARLTRSLAIELADFLEFENGRYVLRSGGAVFDGPAAGADGETA